MLELSGFDGIFIGNGESEFGPGDPHWFFNKVRETNDGGAAPLDRDTFNKFAWQVRMDLGRIASEPIGADLLRLIGLRHGGTGIGGKAGIRAREERTWVGQKVYIAPNLSYVQAMSKTFGFASKHLGAQTKTAPDAYRQGQFGNHIRKTAKGYSSVVRYINQALDPKIDVKKTTQFGVMTPAWISLAHELIHAFHNISGNAYPERVDDVKREELYTTGVGPYKNTRISENAIRKEHGFPLRPHYYSRLRDAKIVGVDCAWLSQSWGGSAHRMDL
jgi:hypothetical protein